MNETFFLTCFVLIKHGWVPTFFFFLFFFLFIFYFILVKVHCIKLYQNKIFWDNFSHKINLIVNQKLISEKRNTFTLVLNPDWHHKEEPWVHNSPFLDPLNRVWTFGLWNPTTSSSNSGPTRFITLGVEVFFFPKIF